MWPPVRTSTRLEFPVRQCSGFLWFLPVFDADERPTNSEMTVVSIVTTLVLEPVGASSCGGDLPRAFGLWKHDKAKFDVVQSAEQQTLCWGPIPAAWTRKTICLAAEIWKLKTPQSLHHQVLLHYSRVFHVIISVPVLFFARRRGSYRPISLRPLFAQHQPLANTEILDPTLHLVFACLSVNKQSIKSINSFLSTFAISIRAV